MVWALLIAAVFLVTWSAFQTWYIRRTWVRVVQAMQHPAPHPGPLRQDALDLAAEIEAEGFAPGRWLWLAEVRWACLVLQRPDGTRATVLSGDRPPGFDLVSEVVGAASLVTERTALGPGVEGSVRQALGDLSVAQLVAAHDATLAAAGQPPLVVHPADAVTTAVLDYEQRSLQEALGRGWWNAAVTVWRNVSRRMPDTTPVVERPDDLARLRPAAPR